MAFSEHVPLLEGRAAAAASVAVRPRWMGRIWGSELRGWQARIADFCEDTFRSLQRVARHRALVCVAMAVVPMGIRFAALPWKPIPAPYIYDESSNILAADTFRSGRLTNPTPAMWRHFEPFHELMRPTYQSKYPPAQALFLALGWKLMGHPWYGVWISFGLMCGCLCWMLQGWVPPVYSLLGTLVAMAQLGIFTVHVGLFPEVPNAAITGYWMNSYWGGAVAAAGGALVIGALPRLFGRPSFAASVLGAAGVAILANSRPYEGGVLVAAAAVALLWWRRRRGRSLRELLSCRNLVPFLVIGGCTAAAMAYYNYRVTGHALTFPYAAYQRLYALVPNWWIFPLNPHPGKVTQPELRTLWYGWELHAYLVQHNNPLHAVYQTAGMWRQFYCPLPLALAIGIALLVFRTPKVWIPAGLIVVVLCSNLIETWHFAHYIAGAAGLEFIIAAYTLRMLRLGGGRISAALVLLCAAAMFAYHLWDGTTAHTIPYPRPAVVQRLMAQGEKHLVIVRYAPTHDVGNFEWVFNAADIDRSPIIWARDLGEAQNRELIEYYRDRKAWLLRPDGALSLEPYPLSIAASRADATVGVRR